MGEAEGSKGSVRWKGEAEGDMRQREGEKMSEGKTVRAWPCFCVR